MFLRNFDQSRADKEQSVWKNELLYVQIYLYIYIYTYINI